MVNILQQNIVIGVEARSVHLDSFYRSTKKLNRN